MRHIFYPISCRFSFCSAKINFQANVFTISAFKVWLFNQMYLLYFTLKLKPVLLGDKFAFKVGFSITVETRPRRMTSHGQFFILCSTRKQSFTIMEPFKKSHYSIRSLEIAN